MPKSRTCSTIFATFCVAASCWASPAIGRGQEQEPITFGTLVDEMIDLGRLAELPKPAFRLINLSSFDRSSNLPGGPGWFSNRDFFDDTGYEQVLKSPGPDASAKWCRR